MNILRDHVENVALELEKLINILELRDKNEYNLGQKHALIGALGLINHALTCRQVLISENLEFKERIDKI